MDRKEKILHKFGQRLATLRKEKNLSLIELAVAAGLRHQQVQQIEAGKVNLLFTTILALAQGLQVSPDELLQSIDFGGL